MKNSLIKIYTFTSTSYRVLKKSLELLYNCHNIYLIIMISTEIIEEKFEVLRNMYLEANVRLTITLGISFNNFSEL